MFLSKIHMQYKIVIVSQMWKRAISCPSQKAFLKRNDELGGNDAGNDTGYGILRRLPTYVKQNSDEMETGVEESSLTCHFY